MEQTLLFPMKAKEANNESLPVTAAESSQVPEATPRKNDIVTAAEVLAGLEPKEFDAGEMFSGKKSNKPVWGFAEPSYYTPERDPNYIFHSTSQDICLWHMAEPEPLYVYGAAGAGKTSLIKQIAASLNYPVFEITGHARLEFADLVGQPTVKDKGMEFQYGPLALAMKYGGICLLNEIDITDPATLCGLNSILDGSPLCIPENQGELIKPHPMFRFVATANSNGRADDTGLYQGVLAQNLAFMDRFWVVMVEYPTKEAETALLSKIAPDLPAALVSSMIDLAGEVRESFMKDDGSGMEVTFSTRTLIRWAKLTLMYAPLARHGIMPVRHALDRALGFKAQPSTKEALHEMVQRIIPASLQQIFNADDDDGADTEDDENEPQLDPVAMATSAPVTPPPGLKVKTWKDDYRADLMRQQGTTQTYFNRKSPVVLLDQSTPSGGKFWQCQATATEVTVNWGPLGTTGQSKVYPKEECKYKNTLIDMVHRIDAKMRNGYDVVHSGTDV